MSQHGYDNIQITNEDLHRQHMSALQYQESASSLRAELERVKAERDMWRESARNLQDERNALLFEKAGMRLHGLMKTESDLEQLVRATEPVANSADDRWRK